jgi:hypothetical protein
MILLGLSNAHAASCTQDVLEAMEFMDVFNAVVHLPNVEVS